MPRVPLSSRSRSLIGAETAAIKVSVTATQTGIIIIIITGPNGSRRQASQGVHQGIDSDHISIQLHPVSNHRENKIITICRQGRQVDSPQIDNQSRSKGSAATEVEADQEEEAHHHQDIMSRKKPSKFAPWVESKKRGFSNRDQEKSSDLNEQILRFKKFKFRFGSNNNKVQIGNTEESESTWISS